MGEVNVVKKMVVGFELGVKDLEIFVIVRSRRISESYELI